MTTSSTSADVTVDDDLRLRFISRKLEKLRDKYEEILEKEETLDFNWADGKERRKVRRSKAVVAGKIDLLEELFNEFSYGQLEEELDEEAAANPPPKSRRRLDNTPLAPHTQQAELNEPPMYLLISNGCAICCLELKQGRGESIITNARDVPPLPKIVTLKLMEEGLPVSVGLLKLGSDAYMIGGQKHPPLSEASSETNDPFCGDLWGENPRGYTLYRTLSSRFNVKGTSRVTYRLSLADHGTLSYSKCNNIGKPKKPKFWPIVEKINGQIHVIDSVPYQFDYHHSRDWIFSHETLNHHTWMEIPTLSKPFFITSHLVVGNRIYAVYGGEENALFDSETNEWEAHPGRGWFDPLSATKVWDFLGVGIARCAGEFPLGGVEEASDLLYVVIAVVRDTNKYSNHGTRAMAYLVTSTGEVVCIQRLRHFFVKPVRPWYIADGTMINVDEEGKTMCSIFNASCDGKDEDNHKWKNYLFINTFSVEMLSEVASKVRKIRAKGRNSAWPVKQEFVRVHMKQRYIFKTDAEAGEEGDLPGFPGVQACFI